LCIKITKEGTKIMQTSTKKVEIHERSEKIILFYDDKETKDVLRLLKIQWGWSKIVYFGEI